MKSLIFILVLGLSVLIFGSSFICAEEMMLWEGYLEFTGKPGTTRSLGISDLFAPLFQDKNDMTFLNVRGNVDFGSDASEFNIGIGHRHMFTSFILGTYTYYDRSKSDLGFNYDQWTTGIEFLGNKWDIRANSYISDKKSNVYEFSQTDHAAKAKIEGDKALIDYSQTTSSSKEQAMSGVDGEVGYKLPFLEDLRVYAGGYHFFGENGARSISGPRVRMEMRLHDIDVLGNGSRLMLGLESQHDRPRGTQTSGLLSIRIPFGIESKKQLKRLKGLNRRMMEPVVRDIDIVAGKNHRVETRVGSSQALNPENLPYDIVLRYTTENSYAEIATEVTDRINSEGILPLVIIKANEADALLQVETTQLEGPATYALAGKELEVGYYNRFTGGISKISFTPEGKTPTQKYQGISAQNALYMGDRVHINGWDIDGSNNEYGLNLEMPGTYYITNTTIKNSMLRNILVKNDGTILHIKDSEIIDSLKIGLWASPGAKVYADNLNVLGNGRNGIVSYGPGTYVEISNSRIANNGTHGLLTDEDGQLYAYNVIIEDNEKYGAISGSNDPSASYLYFEDSIIRNNGEGGIAANADATLEAHRVTLTGNGDGDAGVTAWGGTVNIYDSVISDHKFGLLSAILTNGTKSEINVFRSTFEGNKRIASVQGYVTKPSAIAIFDSVFKEYRGFDVEFIVKNKGVLTGSNNVDGNGENIFLPLN